MGIRNEELWGSQTFGGGFMRKMLAEPPAFLLVLWGWAQFLGYFRFAFVRFVSLSFAATKTLEYITNGLMLLVFLFTVNYLWVHRAWFKKHEVRTLATIWIALPCSMVMVNIMQHNVLHHMVFELQHAMFMLLSGIAILLTGRVVQSRWLFAGGILFALLAFGASFFALKNQMFFEAAAWLVGFVVPGHVMLRKK
jgi:hypothetical protein